MAFTAILPREKLEKGTIRSVARLAMDTFGFSSQRERRYREDTLLLNRLEHGLAQLRNEKGVFVAALSDDYKACWMRDQLYANFAYYFLNDTKKFKAGIRVVFEMLLNVQPKIEKAICYPPREANNFIHAKYEALTLREFSYGWGHHQIDALGLFLFMVGFAEEKGIRVILNQDDRDMIQLLVSYLTSVRYWELPDNGMWEEKMELHASSIGSAVSGLEKIKAQGLAMVPYELIYHGKVALFSLLPNETKERDRDMAQLSLIWPYNVIPQEIADIVLKRITQGLIQPLGINRYLGDNYYRSDNGVSAEWTMGFFWLAIIYADRGEREEAKKWFERGVHTLTAEGYLPELYQNGRPNKNTPLGWAHSLALIAQKKIERA
ncbi:hypothetical protein IID27_03270 [Patescibacteria group bacterium]|nr:hypothetical protein [Patescibacteria group bacterium]